MKIIPILKILFAASLVMPVSCNVKDTIYNTPHPNHGTVVLTTDWSSIGEGINIPAGYTVVAGGYSATLSGAFNRLDYLFVPALQRIDIYNTPEHITVSGTVATVATTAGNADDVGAFVRNDPGWLFTYSGDLRIEKDSDHTYTATMQQQVRRLTLVIDPAGKVARIEGRLSGAAASLNFAAGTYATPSNVELQFTEITSGSDAGKWSATVRLLGVAGAQQKLNATIYFATSSTTAVTLDSDLTAELASFNTDKRTPLTLGGKMVVPPTGAGFTATIKDWTPVIGGPVTAK